MVWDGLLTRIPLGSSTSSNPAFFPAIYGAGVGAAYGDFMYAVIRTGGKQYRVAPGDVLKIERPAGESASEVEFDDVLAFSDGIKPLVKPTGAKVMGTVVSEGRGDKILVFHFKRKKQYKKLQGHRQSYAEIRITGIEVDGFTYGHDKTAQ
jgi:large subunit ribosomal protein L21